MADSLDGHKPYITPYSVRWYTSLVVWLAAAWHIVQPNKPLLQPAAFGDRS